MMRRAFALLILVAATLGATPQLLDSQLVLARYEHALATLSMPRATIFSYAVSQAGAGDLEERHRIYRSGTNVRDETIARNGQTLHPKRVAITSRVDRYAVTRMAPRSSAYRFLFLRTVKNGSHLDYQFETAPIAPNDAFSVTRVTIDGIKFLPTSIEFATAGTNARGSGTIQYGASDGHWVPLVVSVSANVAGKLARERITFDEYTFPNGLPDSTFRAPRPLPTATLPAF